MRKREHFSPAQTRAARGLLDWSVRRLAEAAHLEPEAVFLYERREGELSTAELIVLGSAFNQAGVIAIAETWAGEGVRLREARRGIRWVVVPDHGAAPFDFSDLPLGQRIAAIARVVRQLAERLRQWPPSRVASGR